MPITPSAPDYISSVRGIIGDVRDNFLKKKQLYLQEKDQEDRLSLSYAQLEQQKQLADQQMSMEMYKIGISANNARAQLEAGQRASAPAYTSLQQLGYQNAAKSDLEGEKFKFDQFKEFNKLETEKRKLEQETKEREQDFAASRLLQEGVIALNSDDKTKLIEWTNKMAGTILSSKQQNDVYTNALSLVNAKKSLEQSGVNIKTQPEAMNRVQELNMLDVTRLSSDELAGTLKDYTQRMQALGNTDPKMNDAFMTVSQAAAKRKYEYDQEESAKVFNSFLNDAVLGELDPIYQKQWDDLQREYPDEIKRNSSSDYSNKSRRLMFQANKAKSIEELARMDRANREQGESLVRQNEGLASVREDPTTKTKYKTFTYSGPDLTPAVGFNATIDPVTGLINKKTVTANEKYIAEITSPAYLTGQVPFTRALMSGEQQAVPFLTPEKAKEIASLPYRSSSKTMLPPQTPAGTAPMAVTPVSNTVPISQDTVSRLVKLYEQDPNALVEGKPIREIIAKLKSAGYSIPEIGQSY